ncbi:hypothetical protein VPFG_00097 [Vibrio phage nt-1]|uniref:Uncharacterized protein n=1 Tax=Vibrio phage nt-1 TaxID=115992 RepID=R9TF69_9CAUD|nr:hypothetical protein VPFG_00097 [Vibrio phage nt-1]AGN30099.2 hypothetical protein VPFG_00097 [Vibrio phage nt-1]
MITAEKARARAIRNMKLQFDTEDLEHVEDKIYEAVDECRFAINVKMADEMPNTASHKQKRLLIEYLRLNGYNAFYVADILEIRWQI